jgi:peptidyl-prolyl cis-trans isomerase D
MLKILRGGQRWLTALFVIGIGGVFVFFLGLGGPLSGRSQARIVQVGPHSFGLREFERVRSRREAAVREQFGDAYDARNLADTLDNLAMRELVDTGLLALAAEDLGLTISKREIQQNVRQDPAFRDASGRFDPRGFEDWVEWNYGSQRSFMQEWRLNLLAYKMMGVLFELVHVSPGEVREYVRSQLEELSIAFVIVGSSAPPGEIEIDREALDAAIAARGPEIEELYEELRSRYDVPEQVSARHILIRVERDAEADEVEAKRAVAQAALDRLSAGADFAELARELSEDVGTRERGGDLGFFRRGQMVAEFEDAAFALEPDQLSGLVRTDFGFHVILATGRREAHKRTLEEVYEELADELLRREAGERRQRETIDRLVDAIRAGQSLEAAAREAEIDLQRSGRIQRRGDGFVPGLGAVPELLATAFGLEAGQSSPRVFALDQGLALVQVLERWKPEESEIAARLDAAREELQLAKRELRIDDWLGERRGSLIDSGQLVMNRDALDRR